MASLARTIWKWEGILVWLRHFLQEELAPYPGRGTLVARMVIAATMVMVIDLTFRIPNGAYGAFYALIISREDTRATLRDVQNIVIGFAVAAIYIFLGAAIFAGDAMLRMLWVIGSLFAVFYILSAMANYATAIRYGYLIVISIPIWDRYTTAETKVDQTLWTALAVGISITVTAGVELTFAALRPGDGFSQSIDDRLRAVEQMLRRFAAGQPASKREADELAHLALQGTSRLRRMLQRSASSLNYGEQMGAVVTIVGRLVDVAAGVTSLNVNIPEAERPRIRILAENLGDTRRSLSAGQAPPGIRRVPADAVEAATLPFLQEMEQMVSLIPEIFNDAAMAAHTVLPARKDEPAPLFAPDALTNPRHLRFALKGCLAGSLCYIAYTALDWPEVSTSVTTCYATALSTVGSSRQKQFLRLIGALIGGAAGMGSQVFVLPYLDSIGGFTVLFVAVTSLAAWVATSGPRLSYMGVQIAIAFYLINLQEFAIQTSLAVARDRVIGVLLGLFVMWFVFDQLWGTPAADEVKRSIISIFRSLAKFMRGPFSDNFRLATDECLVLRDRINGDFNHMRDSADAILFEFGAGRQQDLALRNRVNRWQPTLRMLFITRVALVKYRLQAPGFELAPPLHRAQMEFDEQLARDLDGVADRLEGKESRNPQGLEASLSHLEHQVQSSVSIGPQRNGGSKIQSFLPLSRRITDLTASLDREI